MTKTTYKVEELFEDIEGDPDNVIFKIPPEILERTGWKEGDALTIQVIDDAITITKK